MSNSKYLIYDLSSIFSHSENLKLAEKGMNTEHLYLKQINFGLFFSLERKIPVMLKPMPGSVRGMKSLKHIIAEMGLKSIIGVFDREFASYSLPNLLQENEIKYVVPLKRNFKIIDYDMPLNDSFIYRDRGIN